MAFLLSKWIKNCPLHTVGDKCDKSNSQGPLFAKLKRLYEKNKNTLFSKESLETLL